jgi:DNA-directed RNA polymerase specialized sigma24 family protein
MNSNHDTGKDGFSIESPTAGHAPSPNQEQLDQFSDWFSRCRTTLHYMADLILNSSEMAEHAVQNCRHNASRLLPGFESEGEFRGWIFRVLIDEALGISRRTYQAF